MKFVVWLSPRVRDESKPSFDKEPIGIELFPESPFTFTLPSNIFVFFVKNLNRRSKHEISSGSSFVLLSGSTAFSDVYRHSVAVPSRPS